MVSRFLLISIILLLSYNFLQASPKAWVGKNPVSMGESFRFIIEVENEKDPREPDLTVLKDLKVLNRSVQNQTSIVGTKLSRKVIWTYELVSMRSGKIKIPELHAGKGFTESIMLDVLAVNQKNSPQEFLVFEADLDLEEVYPQQQVLLTLKIIRKGVQLENESITPLDIKNTRVRKVYQNSYRNIVKGQQQVVTEIRFSLFAENPGKGQRGKGKSDKRHDAESQATAAIERRKKQGLAGASDDDEGKSDQEKLEALEKALADAGITSDEIEEIDVKNIVDLGHKVLFLERSMDSDAFFSVEKEVGKLLVYINKNHKAYRYLISTLDLMENDDDLEEEGLRDRAHQASKAVNLLLSAWARLEDEAKGDELRKIMLFRRDWGRISEDFLADPDEKEEDWTS